MNAHRNKPLTLAGQKFPSALCLPKLFLDRDAPETAVLVTTIRDLYRLGPKDPDFARHLLLARLVLFPYEADERIIWDDVPENLFATFLDFKLEPNYFIYPNDIQDYYKSLVTTLDMLVVHIERPSTSVNRVITMLTSYIDSLGSHNVMCTDVNMRAFMEDRYRILKLHTRLTESMPFDYPFGARDPLAPKIKLGVLVKTHLAGGETRAALLNLAKLDRSRYEIILLAYNIETGYIQDTAFDEELHAHIDQLIHLPLSDTESCVTMIRALDLDILWHQSHIGLVEFSPAAKTLLYRLARCQCATQIMHTVTTGNPYFGYFLGVTAPAPLTNQEVEFTEKVLRVTGCSMYFPTNWNVPPNIQPTRQSLGIPATSIVFFAGAAAAKYNEPMLDTWCEILAKVPGSRLVLYPFNLAWNPTTLMLIAFFIRLERVMKKWSLDKERIIIMQEVNVGAIELMHHWGDIYLNSFPYGGVTSMNDALRAGIPALCMTGESCRSKGDSVILDAYGLQDFITSTRDAYITLALRLANEPDFLADSKARVKKLWTQRHDSFDDHVATSYAALIDEIAKREFGI